MYHSRLLFRRDCPVAVEGDDAERLVGAPAHRAKDSAHHSRPLLRDSTGGFPGPQGYVSTSLVRDLADIRAGIGGRLYAREARLLPQIFRFSLGIPGPVLP